MHYIFSCWQYDVYQEEADDGVVSSKLEEPVEGMGVAWNDST